MDTQPHKPTDGHGTEYVPTPEEIAVGYELRDTHLRPVIVFSIVLAITVAAAWIIVVGVEEGLDKLERIEASRLPEPSPMSTDASLAHPIPPGPLLEPSPGDNNMPQQDLKELKDEFTHTLGSYAKEDNGFARIPLTSAIDMVVSKGLPSKLPATQPSAGPTMPPASSMHGPGGVP